MSERSLLPAGAHSTDDALLDLLHGLASERERDALLAHHAACPACDQRFRELVAAHERARASAAALLAGADAAGPVRTTSAGGPPARAPRRGGPPPWALAAAALVVVAGAALLLPRLATRPTSTRHAEPVWLPALSQAGERRTRAEAPGDSALWRGIAAYERRDLAAAASLLERPVRDPSLARLRALYLASTLVALGRESEAVSLALSSDAQQLPEPWAGELAWTRLVALERTGDQRRADSLRAELAQRTDAIGERARALDRAARGR